ncbi:hypothetical protein VTK56DRAFT_6712 [Thermocarpiscus australiensis]
MMHLSDLTRQIPLPAAVHPWTLLFAVLGILTLSALARALYNLLLHPLHAYPGPLLSRTSRLPHALRLVSGRGARAVHRLHERHGPVVRLAPDHLSYVDPRAWRDIYGHHHHHRAGSGGLENPKCPVYYQTVFDERVLPTSLIGAGWAEHARLRRAVAPGFSERAMREQEGMIRGYVEALARRLRENVDGEGGRKEAVDLVRWFNWTTFDIVGDLVFAESFGCLEGQRTHPFVHMITATIMQAAIFVGLRYVGLGAALRAVIRFGPKKARMALQEAMTAKLQHRLEAKGERSDLFEGLVKRREEWNLSQPRLAAEASLLVAAGSETTASLLSGATYLLLTNPDAMEKLKHEVRSSFSSADEITLTSVSRLPYMLACLNEALRRWPPAASNFVREVHEGGEIIAGQFVPEKTMVEVQQYAANHYSGNWHDPFSFRPERFLHKPDSETGEEARETGEKNAEGDRVEALQPFSVGPRNCVGKNLAYAEMRLILARIVYDFDLSLADESKDWLQRSRVYTVWEKTPLYVYLTPVKRER